MFAGGSGKSSLKGGEGGGAEICNSKDLPTLGALPYGEHMKPQGLSMVIITGVVVTWAFPT